MKRLLQKSLQSIFCTLGIISLVQCGAVGPEPLNIETQGESSIAVRITSGGDLGVMGNQAQPVAQPPEEIATNGRPKTIRVKVHPARNAYNRPLKEVAAEEEEETKIENDLEEGETLKFSFEEREKTWEKKNIKEELESDDRLALEDSSPPEDENLPFVTVRKFVLKNPYFEVKETNTNWEQSFLFYSNLCYQTFHISACYVDENNQYYESRTIINVCPVPNSNAPIKIDLYLKPEEPQKCPPSDQNPSDLMFKP